MFTSHCLLVVVVYRGHVQIRDMLKQQSEERKKVATEAANAKLTAAKKQHEDWLKVDHIF